MTHSLAQAGSHSNTLCPPQWNGVEKALRDRYPPRFFKEERVGGQLELKVRPRSLLREFILYHKRRSMGISARWRRYGQIQASRQAQLPGMEGQMKNALSLLQTIASLRKSFFL